jgi:hypothetical protein
MSASAEYMALRNVFDEFHAGNRTKQEVAFAIGLWQLQDPPIKPPLIDKTNEWYDTFYATEFYVMEVSHDTR